jgi:hypothetical protein
MRILHVLDHGLPLQSGYSFRTRAIVKAQIERGWEPVCLTGPRHAAEAPGPETVDGITFHRTPAPPPGPSPLREWREIAAFGRRIDEVIRAVRPDRLHVHSPVLNALAALRPPAATVSPCSTRSAPSGRTQQSATGRGGKARRATG